MSEDDEADVLGRIYDAGAGGPWEATEDGLWCPACGDIIAPVWFFERNENYEPPESCRANGYKGHATRITRRAKAGVCPCCNRSFENLRRHMETKHPTFTPMTDLGPLQVIDGGKADAA